MSFQRLENISKQTPLKIKNNIQLPLFVSPIWIYLYFAKPSLACYNKFTHYFSNKNVELYKQLALKREAF